MAGLVYGRHAIMSIRAYASAIRSADVLPAVLARPIAEYARADDVFFALDVLGRDAPTSIALRIKFGQDSPERAVEVTFKAAYSDNTWSSAYGWRVTEDNRPDICTLVSIDDHRFTYLDATFEEMTRAICTGEPTAYHINADGCCGQMAHLIFATMHARWRAAVEGVGLEK